MKGMMAMKFNVGDKVRIVGGYHDELKGRIAVVTEGEQYDGDITRMVATDPTLDQHRDNFRLGGNDFHYCFTLNQLELVQ
jgi:hypothetical protein